jgi:hypothetical protein
MMMMMSLGSGIPSSGPLVGPSEEGCDLSCLFRNHLDTSPWLNYCLFGVSLKVNNCLLYVLLPSYDVLGTP